MKPELAAAFIDQSDIGWQAGLRLGFARRDGRTRLVERQHHGPLTVQKAFYPEGDVCHVYLLHPPGGIVGGDCLQINASARPAAQALLTTPAAGKFYRSAGPTARQQINLQVAEQASLEWLPQETIVYDGARLDSNLNIELAATGRWLGWEVMTLGLPAANEQFSYGQALLNWRIRIADKTVYRERLLLDAEAMQSVWGLQGHNSCGSLFAYPANAELVQSVQTLIGDQPGHGVTLIDGLLICRALDDRADHLRQWFEQVWRLIRPAVIGQPACAPRIWAT